MPNHYRRTYQVGTHLSMGFTAVVILTTAILGVVTFITIFGYGLSKLFPEKSFSDRPTSVTVSSTATTRSPSSVRTSTDTAEEEE